MRSADPHFKLPMKDLMNEDKRATGKFHSIYGKDLTESMRSGLGRLCDESTDLGEDADAQLIEPTLEGVGWYPSVDGDLRISEAPLYVVGDACGLLRGIVAAMISGHYGAAAALEDLKRYSGWQEVLKL